MTRSNNKQSTGPSWRNSVCGAAKRSISPDTQNSEMVDVDVDKLTSPLTGTNPLAVDQLSTAERITEIGQLLAIGAARALHPQTRDNSTGHSSDVERSCTR